VILFDNKLDVAGLWHTLSSELGHVFHNTMVDLARMGFGEAIETIRKAKSHFPLLREKSESMHVWTEGGYAQAAADVVADFFPDWVSAGFVEGLSPTSEGLPYYFLSRGLSPDSGT
jgi:hypothetical protein